MRPTIKENVAAGRFLERLQPQDGAVERLRRFEILGVDTRFQDASDFKASTHLPFHSGFLFSRKARRPSVLSSVSQSAPWANFSSASPAVMLPSMP